MPALAIGIILFAIFGIGPAAVKHNGVPHVTIQRTGR